MTFEQVPGIAMVGKDPASFPPGRLGQMAVRPPSAAKTAPVT
jgi:hypothetical protein